MKLATVPIMMAGFFFAVAPYLSAAQEASTLECLAEQVTLQIEQRLSPPRGPVAAVLSLEAEGESLEGNSRLVQTLEGLLQHRLSESHALSQFLLLSPSEGAAGLERAQRAGAGWWIRLQVGLKKKQLQVCGDLLPLVSTFWERLAGRVPAAVAYHFVVACRQDEEALRLAEQHRYQPFLGAWNIVELLRRPGRFLDVATGNLDGQGAEEIVWLSGEQLEILRWEGGETKTLAQYSFSHLPRSAEAVREPIGRVLTADVNRDGQEEILFGVGSYRQGEILSWNGATLHALRRFDGLPLCVITREQRLHLLLGHQTAGWFTGQLNLVDINSPSGDALSLGSPFLHLECVSPQEWAPNWRLLEPDGTVSQISADGRKVLLSGCGRGTVWLPGTGVDQPTWLASEAVYPGQADSLRIIRDGVQQWITRDFVGGVVASTLSRNPSASGWHVLVLTVEEGEGVSRLYLLRR